MDTSKPVKASFVGTERLAGNILRDAFQKYKATVSKGDEQLRLSRSELASHIRNLKARTRSRAFDSGIKNAAKQTSKFLKQLEQQYQDTISTIEKHVLLICLESARQVIGEEAHTLTNAIKTKVNETLDNLKCLSPVTVGVNPAHAALLQDPKFEADESINDTTVVIRTTSGSIELDWDKHFEQLMNELVNRL